MNDFLNEQTNKMHLQYGSKKCVKMHVRKKQDQTMCCDLSVDSWKDKLKKKVQMGRRYLKMNTMVKKS